MTVNDFIPLPASVTAGVLLMFWPAIWAAVSLTIALVGDLAQRKRRRPLAARKAA